MFCSTTYTYIYSVISKRPELSPSITGSLSSVYGSRSNHKDVFVLKYVLFREEEYNSTRNNTPKLSLFTFAIPANFGSVNAKNNENNLCK